MLNMFNIDIDISPGALTSRWAGIWDKRFKIVGWRIWHFMGGDGENWTSYLEITMKKTLRNHYSLYTFWIKNKTFKNVYTEFEGKYKVDLTCENVVTSALQ